MLTTLQNAYVPREPAVAAGAAALLLAVLAAGFLLCGLPSAAARRTACWSMVPIAGVAMDWLCRTAPPGFRMLALSGVLLYAMKAVVAAEERADGEPPLTLPQWLAFTVAWVGMRPEIFRALGGPPRPDAGTLLLRGLSRILGGLALILLARGMYDATAAMTGEAAGRVAATLLLLPGVSLFLHFGVLVVAAGIGRFAGLDCRPLFREPLRSRTLADFWGRRWNLAFTEMTALAVYRPLEPRVGKAAALLAGFVFSGLLHEAAISVPVRAGYGLPTLYFLLHGCLVLVEQALERRGRPIERPTWRGRLWTIAWLALPAPILFHPPFLKGVIWPLIGL